jgi:hypothetical protein
VALKVVGSIPSTRRLTGVWCKVNMFALGANDVG